MLCHGVSSYLAELVYFAPKVEFFKLHSGIDQSKMLHYIFLSTYVVVEQEAIKCISNLGPKLQASLQFKGKGL